MRISWLSSLLECFVRFDCTGRLLNPAVHIKSWNIRVWIGNPQQWSQDIVNGSHRILHDSSCDLWTSKNNMHPRWWVWCFWPTQTNSICPSSSCVYWPTSMQGSPSVEEFMRVSYAEAVSGTRQLYTPTNLPLASVDSWALATGYCQQFWTLYISCEYILLFGICNSKCFADRKIKDAQSVSSRWALGVWGLTVLTTLAGSCKALLQASCFCRGSRGWWTARCAQLESQTCFFSHTETPWCQKTDLSNDLTSPCNPGMRLHIGLFWDFNACCGFGGAREGSKSEQKHWYVCGCNGAVEELVCTCSYHEILLICKLYVNWSNFAFRRFVGLLCFNWIVLVWPA